MPMSTHNWGQVLQIALEITQHNWGQVLQIALEITQRNLQDLTPIYKEA